MNGCHCLKPRPLVIATLLALIGLCPPHLTAAPGTPLNLTAVDSGANGIYLSWQPPDSGDGDPAEQYRVYRRAFNATKTQIVHAWQRTTPYTSWTQTGLSPLESYEYQVAGIRQLPDQTWEEGPRTAMVVHALKRFPFVLPWDGTATNSITDNSNWNGTIQRIFTATDGTFRLGSPSGAAIRFVGVNLSGAACFPDPADAPLVAKRMAQFGINLVRLHQMDQPKPKGVFTDGTYASLDSGQMTKLGTLVKALKDQGIYVDLNLRVLLKYPNPDNGGAYELLKGVDIYSTAGGTDSLRNRQKNYANQLLNYPNSDVAGLSKYKDDPVVAMIEISNEDGLFAEWIDGEIDALQASAPTFYSELGSLWKSWLSDKYTTDRDLSHAWSGQTGSSYGMGLLTTTTSSPSAGSVSSPWQAQISSPAAGTITWVTGASVGSPAGNAARIDVTSASTSEKWRAQLLLNNLFPDSNTPHTLRFYGKTDSAQRDIRIVYRNGQGDVIHNIASLSLSPTWQEFTIALPPTGSYQNSRTISFTDFAAQTGVSYLSGFSLTTGNELAGPLAAAAEYNDGNITNAITGTTATYNFPSTGSSLPAGWSLEKKAVATATSQTFVPDGRAPDVPSLSVNLIQPGTGAKDTILRRILWTQLQFGSSYELTFDVKGSVAGTITARGQMHATPYSTWNETTCAVSTDWVTRRLRFNVNNDNDLATAYTATRIDFDLGLMPSGSSIDFANISVRALPDNVLTTTPATFNFPSSGDSLPTGWEILNKNGAANVFVYVTGGRTNTPQDINSLRITATTGGAVLSDAILRRVLNTQLAYGKTYTLSFDVKASTGFDLVARGQMHSSAGYTVFGSATHTISTTWSERTVTFTVFNDSDNDPASVPCRVDFDLGLLPAGQSVEFANIAIREGGATGMTNTETLGGDISPVSISGFHSRTRQVQTDWLEFLWDTELSYWQDMKTHVKSMATYTLVLGTQGELSPNLLQAAAGLDIIDAHGYWQHPTSFSAPWNYVNASMAGITDDAIPNTTIPRRAGRRIIGKPYLCSEYNHPAPNTYGTEAMPLIGAYASMQGWAGVLAFDYENQIDAYGKIGWDKGMEGWFSMGRAPAKMVTMPAARAMLDRGQVTKAYGGGIAGTAYAAVGKATAIEMIRQMLTPAISAVDFGVSDSLTYVMPVGMKYVAVSNEPDHRAVPAVIPSSPYKSAAGDLSWDTTARLVAIKALRSKAAIGNMPLSGSVDLGDGVTISSPGLQLQGSADNWSAFVLTRTDDQTTLAFGGAGTRWLLTTTGYSDNHLLKWNPDQGPENATSSVTNFGQPPTLLESIDGTLTFKVPAGTLVVHALDENGEDTGQTVTVVHAGSGASRTATVTLPQPALTPWYEMSVQ